MFCYCTCQTTNSGDTPVTTSHLQRLGSRCSCYSSSFHVGPDSSHLCFYSVSHKPPLNPSSLFFVKEAFHRAEDVAHWLTCLLYKHKDLSFIPNNCIKFGCNGSHCDPNARKEMGTLGLNSWLVSEETVPKNKVVTNEK